MNHDKYSSEDLQQFETLIKERLERETGDLADLQRQREEHGNRESGHNDSYGDDAKADQILSRLSTLVEHKLNYVQKLEYSLMRVENGTYGIDNDTGKKIVKERLLAELTALHNI